MFRLARFLRCIRCILSVRAGKAADRCARRKKVTQAEVLRQQLLVVLGEGWLVGARADVVGRRVALAVKLNLVILAGTIAPHLNIQILVAETPAAGNRMWRIGVKGHPGPGTACLTI